MQQHIEYEEEEEEIDLDSIEDEATLIQLLDDTEDIDERKRIRDRLQKVRFEIKAQREADRKRWDDARELKIRERVRQADLKKQETLKMYDEMAKAKSKPKDEQTGPRDLVEKTIQDRVKAADDRKKRIMAAYEHAASSQPAGTARIVHFDDFKRADVSKMQPAKPIAKGSCCFGMSGGVPVVEKAPVMKSAPAPADDSHLDPRERAIRARVREAEERKKKILAAYDSAARTGGAGPKDFILGEHMNVDPNVKQAPKYDPCFRSGIKI